MARNDQGRVPEGVPFAFLFLFGSVDAELLHVIELGCGEAPPTRRDLEFRHQIATEYHPGSAPCSSRQFGDYGLPVPNGKLGAQRFARFTQPDQRSGLAVLLNLDIWNRLVCMPVAV